MNEQPIIPAKSPVKKSFAERHHHILVLLGATIILATFIARDYYLEKKKDERDAASSQREALQFRGDLFELRVKIDNLPLRTLQDTAQDLLRLVPHNPTTNTEWQTFFGMVIMDGGAQLRGERDMITKITDIIGQSDATRANELNAKAKAYEDATKAGVDDLLKKVMKEPERAEFFIKMYLLDDLKRDLALNDEVFATERIVVKNLQTVESETQRSYDRAADISYGVFAIGWGLALFGRWKGIPIETGG